MKDPNLDIMHVPVGVAITSDTLGASHSCFKRFECNHSNSRSPLIESPNSRVQKALPLCNPHDRHQFVTPVKKCE